ncbi:MAG: ABC transporter ATP-binding protein/permease [Oscillospiraceae bacterium]|nr:ABC transporter ATP-binding protein/permease [Oscillospiraceae bacterium]
MARNKFDIDETLESPFSFSHLKKAGKYIKKHTRKMVICFVLSVFSIVCSLSVPQIIMRAMGVTFPNKDHRELVILAIAATLLIAVSIVLARFRSVIMMETGQEIIRDIRADLFAHLQKLPFQYYDSRPNGKILVRVIHYVNNVADFLSSGVINFIVDLLSLIFILVFMLITSPSLTLIAMSGTPVFLLVIILIKPRQRRAWQAVSNKNSNLTAYLSESLDGVKITQIFTRENENAEIYNTLNTATSKAWKHAQFLSCSIQPTSEVVLTITTVVLYMTGTLLFAPTTSLAVVVAMGAYTQRFWQPIISISNLYNSFITAISYLERIFETMEEPVHIDDCDNAYTLPEITGQLEFKNVTFSYDPHAVILEDVSFTINPGESIALVGATGAGKTTIVNLISRFYDLSGGQLLIDGHDISKVTLHSLRSQMGIMLQDSFIFSGTIIDNIRYGKLDATPQEVEAACKTVCAHEFISNLPDGYNTELPERGGGLSSGEKQLISFARTLISDPKILILDEATSSIDTKLERYLQEGLKQLLVGRTSFIIAHRLSTIKNCDKIMYVANKGITECGTHDELMELKGDYYALCTSQDEGN